MDPVEMFLLVVKRLAAWVAIWMLCAVAAAAGLAMLLPLTLASQQRAWRVVIGFDQAANALLGGSEDETISSRAARTRQERRWARYLCRLMDAVDPGHCERSGGV